MNWQVRWSSCKLPYSMVRIVGLIFPHIALLILLYRGHFMRISLCVSSSPHLHSGGEDTFPIMASLTNVGWVMSRSLRMVVCCFLVSKRKDWVLHFAAFLAVPDLLFNVSFDHRLWASFFIAHFMLPGVIWEEVPG
jgi:hypothetical protein